MQEIGTSALERIHQLLPSLGKEIERGRVMAPSEKLAELMLEAFEEGDELGKRRYGKAWSQTVDERLHAEPHHRAEYQRRRIGDEAWMTSPSIPVGPPITTSDPLLVGICDMIRDCEWCHSSSGGHQELEDAIIELIEDQGGEQ